MEAFKGRNGQADTEVLFLYQNPIDDFVMTNLGSFNNRKLVTAEVGSLDIGKDGSSSSTYQWLVVVRWRSGVPIRPFSWLLQRTPRRRTSPVMLWTMWKACQSRTSRLFQIGSWMLLLRGNSRVCRYDTEPCNICLCGPVSHVVFQVTTRLVESPAVVTDHESAAMRRMYKLMQQSSEGDASSAVELPKQKLEINVKHPIIIGLDKARANNPPLAVTIAEQVFDNALTAAGLMDDPRVMLPRLNSLLETLATRASLGGAVPPPPAPEEENEDKE